MTALLEAAFARLLKGKREANAHRGERRREPREPADGGALLEWIDEADVPQAELVKLADRSPNGFGFHSKRELLPGTPVLLTENGPGAVKAVVRRSAGNPEGGFDHGVRVIREERRRHDRVPLDEPATLAAIGVRGESIDVRIRDASESGVQLESPVEIGVDTPVRVAHGGWHRSGVVAHTVSHDGAYRLGIHFVGPAEPDR